MVHLYSTYSPTWDKRTHTARMGVVHRLTPITGIPGWPLLKS